MASEDSYNSKTLSTWLPIALIKWWWLPQIGDSLKVNLLTFALFLSASELASSFSIEYQISFQLKHGSQKPNIPYNWWYSQILQYACSTCGICCFNTNLTVEDKC